VDLLLEDGDIVDALGGLRVLHTPGHTPGSISLYQPERGIVFCGDLLFNAHPVTGKVELQYPMSLISFDDDRIRASAARLGELDVGVLCTGHGPPITEDAGARIRDLVNQER
jgi:glyoxylase-like metal-dependent hydrolase (beta-lactamase superfamily II)